MKSSSVSDGASSVTASSVSNGTSGASSTSSRSSSAPIWTHSNPPTRRSGAEIAAVVVLASMSVAKSSAESRASLQIIASASSRVSLN